MVLQPDDQLARMVQRLPCVCLHAGGEAAGSSRADLIAHDDEVVLVIVVDDWWIGRDGLDTDAIALEHPGNAVGQQRGRHVNQDADVASHLFK